MSAEYSAWDVQTIINGMKDGGWTRPVRCKDCIHAMNTGKTFVCWDSMGEPDVGKKVDANDYCSFGERKERDASD